MTTNNNATSIQTTRNGWRVEKENSGLMAIFNPNGIKIVDRQRYFDDISGFACVAEKFGVNKLYNQDGSLELDNLLDPERFGYFFFGGNNGGIIPWVVGRYEDQGCLRQFLIDPSGKMLVKGVKFCKPYCTGWYRVDNKIYNPKNQMMGETPVNIHLNRIRVYINEMFLLNQGNNVFQLFDPQGEEIQYKKNENEYLYQNGYRLDISNALVQILFDQQGEKVHQL